MNFQKKIVVTIFHDDTEAENLWKKISGLSEKNNQN